MEAGKSNSLHTLRAKYLLILSITAMITTPLFAQEAITLDIPKTREIGAFVESSPENGNDLTFVGIRYTRWKDAHLGYRIFGGYANSNSSDILVSRVFKPDTMIERLNRQNIKMGMAGFGLECQRHFYKRIVLFAAVDLRVGYGSGKADSITSTYYNEGDRSINIYNKMGNSPISMLYVGLSPTVGCKLQFNRFNFGMELVSGAITSKTVKENGRSSSVSDFSLAPGGTRMFFNFKL